MEGKSPHTESNNSQRCITTCRALRPSSLPTSTVLSWDSTLLQEMVYDSQSMATGGRQRLHWQRAD
eukprot:2221003-Amphidinium_carterae.1